MQRTGAWPKPRMPMVSSRVPRAAHERVAGPAAHRGTPGGTSPQNSRIFQFPQIPGAPGGTLSRSPNALSHKKKKSSQSAAARRKGRQRRELRDVDRARNSSTNAPPRGPQEPKTRETREIQGRGRRMHRHAPPGPAPSRAQHDEENRLDTTGNSRTENPLLREFLANKCKSALGPVRTYS